MRKFLLSMLLGILLFWTAQGAAAVNGLDAAYRITVQGPLQGDRAGRRIFGLPRMTTPGMVVEGWRSHVMLPQIPGFLLFVDDEPEANWEHPARLVFVNPVDGVFTVYDVRTPPKIFSELIELGKYEPKPRTSKTHATIAVRRISETPASQNAGSPPNRDGEGFLATTFDDGMLTVNPDHKFAVLISGGYYASSNAVRYWNDTAFMYKVLKYRYGYKDENIYVLCSDGLDPAPDNKREESSNVDLDGDGLPDVDYSATIENVDTVFGELAARMTEDDILFVFTTGHGAPYDPDGDPTKTVLYLWHNYIVDDELAEQVNRIQSYDTMVFVMSQCYSGGFEGELGAPNRIFISAAAYDEISYAGLFNPDTGNYEYDVFSHYFTCALAGARPDGGEVRADADGDGAVSIAEAFSFAVNNDPAYETPQFLDQSKFAELDPLMGAHVISLDGRFATSFTFQDQDVLTYSVWVGSGSMLRTFVRNASEYPYNWVVSLGDDPTASAMTSGSTLNWFSPAITRGRGTRTAKITSGKTPTQISGKGFVKFVLSGGAWKHMTVTQQP